MMKKKRIWEIAAVAAFMAVLISANGTPKQRGQNAAEDRMEPADGEEEKLPAETEQEGTEVDENDFRPLLAEIPGEKRVELVFYSEGCYCYYNGSLYGYISETGEEIAPCIFREAAPFSEGLACVRLDDQYGYIGKDGETVLPFLYDQASSFQEGLAYFSTGDSYGFMDRAGRVVLRPDCDSISSFSEGLAFFCVDGRYGYMDRSGRIVTEPVYDDAGYFRDGIATVMQNGYYGIVGKDGREILAPEYEAVWVNGSYIIAKKGTASYCFDREGRQISGGWDNIYVQGDLLCIKQDEKYGLADSDGNLLLEVKYDWIDPIPGKELVIANQQDICGVLDYHGQIKVPFQYDAIRCFDEKGDNLYISRAGKYGYLDGTDFSETIPAVYDFLSPVIRGRAVVGLEGKYGVIGEDGILEIPIKYDGIRICSNGALILRRNGTTELWDEQGNVLLSGQYDDIIDEGDCYEVKKDGEHGFLDRHGKEVIPVSWSYTGNHEIYGGNNIKLLSEYGAKTSNMLIQTGEKELVSLEQVFFNNYITPKAGAFFTFLQEGAFQVGDIEEGGYVREMQELNACRKFCKLFRFGEQGAPVLYVYASSWIPGNFPESYSGLYGLWDGSVETLATGYQCGGSSGGDHVCFWYDKETSERKPGVEGYFGGFGGTACVGEVYDQQDETISVISFGVISQSAENYSKTELEQDACLFYGGNGCPYTPDSIGEAEHVTEYSVNDQRTTIEEYRKIRDRYRYLMVVES